MFELVIFGINRGHESPMSRRNFGQPSLADAFVKSCSRHGGFLEDIGRTFVWAVFNVLMRPLHSSSAIGR